MNGVSFPFSQKASEFEPRAKEKMQKLSPKARKLIRRLKPYRGGNDSLYLLNALDIADKHRTILLCSVYAGHYKGNFSCDHPIQMSPNWFGTLENGIHLFTVPSKAAFQHNLRVTFTVAFAEFAEIEGQPVVIVLTQLADRVERIIRMFERLFFKSP